MVLGLLFLGLVAGNTAAMARAIAVVENGRPGFEKLLAEVHRSLGKARRIGITGPPGAGNGRGGRGAGQAIPPASDRSLARRTRERSAFPLEGGEAFRGDSQAR